MDSRIVPSTEPVPGRVRARMRVNSIIRQRGSIWLTDPDDPSKQKMIAGEIQTVKLGIVHSTDPEINSFSKATPAGLAELSISNPDVVRFFELDHDYYLDFVPVDPISPFSTDTFRVAVSGGSDLRNAQVSNG